jgi:hypothetical protein
MKIDAGSPLCKFVYVYDQVFLAEKEHLQKGVYTLNIVLELYNMKISESKSEVVAVRQNYMIKSKNCSKWNNSGTDQRFQILWLLDF